MRRYAVIVAGGKGTRMQSELPKQFLDLDGKPIIVHTIERFLEADASIVLVLPADQLAHWEGLKAQYLPDKTIYVTRGGSSRTASVMSGLRSIEDKIGLVAVHDAVRPYVTLEIIRSSFEAAERYGSGVAAVPLKDSIRKLLPSEHSVARNRANFVLVQTPQTFRLEEIISAYDQVGDQSFTDDATVYENAGYQVHLVEGSYSNIKITTPEDLA